MARSRGRFMVSLLVIGLACPAISGERRAEPGVPSPGAATTLTGKERLGPKWTDEQRIDNCKVPPDKRGAKARPIVCPNSLTN